MLAAIASALLIAVPMRGEAGQDAFLFRHEGSWDGRRIDLYVRCQDVGGSQPRAVLLPFDQCEEAGAYVQSVASAEPPPYSEFGRYRVFAGVSGEYHVVGYIRVDEMAVLVERIRAYYSRSAANEPDQVFWLRSQFAVFGIDSAGHGD